jgi:hypothetical protein
VLGYTAAARLLRIQALTPIPIGTRRRRLAEGGGAPHFPPLNAAYKRPLKAGLAPPRGGGAAHFPPLTAAENGASRTRTGDLLGAISALSGPEFGLISGFPSLRVSSPNTFPNTLQPVLQ